jgi:DNA-binding CsgD family transcriptional regulator
VTTIGPVVDALSPDPGNTDAPPPHPSAPSDGRVGNNRSRDRLLKAVEELETLLRRKEMGEDCQDAVLLDAVVGNIRFVIVERIASHLVELTPRQHQIALMVARGRTNHTIANALGISVWTVSTHLQRIFAKLTVSNRAEMAAHLLAQAEFVSQIDQRPLA